MYRLKSFVLSFPSSICFTISSGKVELAIEKEELNLSKAKD